MVGFVSKYRRSCGDAQVGSRWLASLLLAVAALLFTGPFAAAETRSLKLYFIHTKEKAEIVFKRNGRYDQGGLKQISRLLRDWRWRRRFLHRDRFRRHAGTRGQCGQGRNHCGRELHHVEKRAER